MNRLHVTETERLCYSRRKLHAISALRHADIDIAAFGLHKDYRVPGVKGKVYLVKLPDGAAAHFTRLVDIITYANNHQQWQTVQHVLAGSPDAISWEAWQRDPLKKLQAANTAHARAIEQIPSPRWQSLFLMRNAPIVDAAPQPARQPCAWKDGCSYDALPEQAYCAGHAFMARQIYALTKGRE